MEGFIKVFLMVMIFMAVALEEKAEDGAKAWSLAAIVIAFTVALEIT